jgi:ADP-ribosylglycohydrolase
VAQATQLLALRPQVSPEDFAEIVADAVEPFEERFAEILRQLPDLVAMKHDAAARIVATAGMFDRDLSQPIITPFVVPTVLAAFWALLKFGGDWPRAVGSAIRLGGNTDALGALVGALAGAKLGVAAIPPTLRTGVRDGTVIVRLARDYAELLAAADATAARQAA